MKHGAITLTAAAALLALSAPAAVAQQQGGQMSNQSMQNQQMHGQQMQGQQTQGRKAQQMRTQGQGMQGQQARSQQMQGGQNAQQQRQARFTPIGEWDYNALYKGGFRGEDLLDAEVFGAEGDDRNEEIGDVESVLLDQQGRIVAIVAEVGGFWDMADTHVAVPWNEVSFVSDGIRIPVNEERVEDYGLFSDNAPFSAQDLQSARRVDDDLTTGQRIWRLGELVDDYVVLSDGAGYGYVDDAIFDKTGQIQAVVVSRDAAYGAGGEFAYPFNGYNAGWQPGYDYYQLPYNAQEVAEMDEFDPDRMDNAFWD